MNRVDVIVVGAGPAGAVAAREAARHGAAVVLVEKATFPRAKVCGCCLNPAALETLNRIGLGELPSRAGGVPLRTVRLVSGGRFADIPLGGVSLSRERFDTALVQAAHEAGVQVRFGTTARLLPASANDSVRRVELTSSTTGRTELEAGVVVAADGLNGRLTAGETGGPVIAAHSRIGAGTHLESAPDWCPRGRLVMIVGRGGYVGLVRLEDDRLDVAAAFDGAAVRAAGGLGLAARNVLQENDMMISELSTAPWRGTPPLTRRAAPAGFRWFAIGDAARYVEPFTGQGMQWAVQAGARLGPQLAHPWTPAAANHWRTGHPWNAATCRVLARVVRWPVVSGLLVRMLTAAPGLARPIVARFGTSRQTS